MFTISPQWLLKQIGLDGAVDPETAEMATLLLMRYQSAQNKPAFVKETLRKALMVAPEAGPAHGAGTATSPKRRMR